ncbi:MAG: hypothetical protein LCH32_05775 [Bacteroidetes bacterium]|nr:hypothetical protein [Bacteroidota bacterium]
MKSLTLNIALLSIITFILVSCKKDKSNKQESNTLGISYSDVQFNITTQSNNPTIILDSLNNTNAAGNIYSIHKLNMYISNIILKKEDGTLYKSDKVFYVDPSQTSKNFFQLDSIPKGKYIEFSCLIGVDSTRNVSSGLSSTIDNVNMAWPAAMGGGYHFIKMEGHYKDTAGTVKGYAIHLGKNINLVKNKFSTSLTLLNSVHNCSLVFNTNEVFQNPHLYNLNFEKNYTMSDSVAMSKIKINMQDVFTLIQNN